MVKALVLFSGGLDSLLALRVMQDQPVEVEAMHGVSLFTRYASTGGGRLWPAVAAERLGVELHLVETSQQILETVNAPRHGFGSAANPCIDCRIAMLRRAAGMMEAIGASFLVTGEVVGQRPMSQRRFAIDLIEREVGLEGLILRPLTALNLPPTLPEQRGWIDRSKLLAFQGRSRKPQMALAAQYGIFEYPTAAGGCLLTDPAYGARIHDLLTHGPVTLNDAHVCKIGRHLRLGAWGKAVVGRNAAENPKLITLARNGEWLMELADRPGPTTLLRPYGPTSGPSDEDLQLAARITARYTRARGPTRVCAWRKATDERRALLVEPIETDDPAIVRI